MSFTLTTMPVTPRSELHEIPGPCVVNDLNARLFRRAIELIDQTAAAAHGGKRSAAPKREFAVDLEGLPAKLRKKAHAVLPHPMQRRIALLDQDLA